MASFRGRARHSRFQSILGTIFVLPIIAILGFLDVIPVSDALSWLALGAFLVGLIVLIVSFKGKNPANES
ncbi:hypothetical protein JCM19047_2535 [Bacillus sp. JCM 19047]|uniref:hypothetical protein n=1 Tax=Shouchella miscanthi TaxID=2598861 RepID=UPI0003F053AC|nr:hypothetical protein [Shouchella miscanthi]GAF22766.1 hypothetical protein JCM19047_2535 [Bacillus sp. JCM 19047]